MSLTTGTNRTLERNSLLPVKAAAAAMGVTAWWVRRLIASGELRGINVGGFGTAARWRVDPEDLAAWLASRQNRPRDLTAP